LNLTSLTTRNVRNLADRAWSFHPSVNLFLGDNGQGKTNLLEAIHLLATTKSFRTTRNQNVVRFDATELFAEGLVASGPVEKTISIGLTAGDERRRALLVNGQKTTLGSYVRQLQVVAYSAAQLEVVRGGPEVRRRFIDRAAAARDPGHMERLIRYGRTLRQRNVLLVEIATGRSRPSTLDAWDHELVTAARPVIAARADYIARLQVRHQEIASSHDYHLTDLGIVYRPAGLGGATPEDDLKALRENRSRELRSGHSLAGPHRDQIELTTRDRPAAEVLSSGEVKMTVLFLTLASLELYREKFDESPLFLLDDIDAELDLGILRRLTRYLIESTQVFTTSAKESILRDLGFGPHRQITLRDGAPSDIRDV
jgi:DNA replication and repair protein RecF